MWLSVRVPIEDELVRRQCAPLGEELGRQGVLARAELGPSERWSPRALRVRQGLAQRAPLVSLAAQERLALRTARLEHGTERRPHRVGPTGPQHTVAAQLAGEAVDAPPLEALEQQRRLRCGVRCDVGCSDPAELRASELAVRDVHAQLLAGGVALDSAHIAKHALTARELEQHELALAEVRQAPRCHQGNHTGDQQQIERECTPGEPGERVPDPFGASAASHAQLAE